MMKFRFLILFLAFLVTSLVSIGNVSTTNTEKGKYTISKKTDLPGSQQKSNNVLFTLEEEEEGEEDETTIRKAPNQISEEDGLSHHQQLFDFTLPYLNIFSHIGQKVTSTPLPTPFTPPDFLISNA